MTLTEYLGGESKLNVPLYANINRCLLGDRRTPRDFGNAAELHMILCEMNPENKLSMVEVDEVKGA